MNFFQTVDPATLQGSCSTVCVAIQVLLLVLFGSVCGIGIAVIPALWAGRGDLRYGMVPVPGKAPLRPTHAVPKPAAPQPAAPDPSKPAPSAPVGQPPEPAKETDAALHSALDRFFEEEALLDEVLLDVSGQAPGDPGTAGEASPVEPPAKSTKGADKAMAERMMREYQRLHGKPQVPTVAIAAAADATLDQALDDFLTEQQMLDDAMLDSALNEANADNERVRNAPTTP